MSYPTNIEEVDKGIKLGVKPNGMWYAYIYAYDPLQKKDKSRWVSTKIKYEDGRKANRNKARRVALQMAEEIAPKIGITADPFKIHNVADIAKEWKDLVCDLADKNEKLVAANKAPIHEVYGGKEGKYWNKSKKEQVIRFHNYLEGFWTTLPEQDITKIRNKDLNTLRDWAKKHDWSPSHVGKMGTQIRKIWLYAESKDLVDFAPRIKAPAVNAKQASRRFLTQENFEMMFEYTRARYQQPRIALRMRDAYLQFHCWLLICSNTGIRPPSRIKNAMRWEDYKVIPKTKDEDEIRLLHRANEKELEPYDALILPGAYEAFEMLEELYKDRGMGKPEYLFAHTHERKAGDASAGIKKGDPILTYRKQWETMLIKLGLETKSIKQSERLAPYSMRGYFHTKMFDDYPTLGLENIARMTGTSEKMLRQSYINVSTEKTARQLASLVK